MKYRDVAVLHQACHLIRGTLIGASRFVHRHERNDAETEIPSLVIGFFIIVSFCLSSYLFLWQLLQHRFQYQHQTSPIVIIVIIVISVLLPSPNASRQSVLFHQLFQSRKQNCISMLHTRFAHSFGTFWALPRGWFVTRPARIFHGVLCGRVTTDVHTCIFPEKDEQASQCNLFVRRQRLVRHARLGARAVRERVRVERQVEYVERQLTRRGLYGIGKLQLLLLTRHHG